MYLAEAPTCALYHQSHSIVTVQYVSDLFMRVSQPLNHLRIEARTDDLLEIGSDKTHF